MGGPAQHAAAPFLTLITCVRAYRLVTAWMDKQQQSRERKPTSFIRTLCLPTFPNGSMSVLAYLRGCWFDSSSEHLHRNQANQTGDSRVEQNPAALAGCYLINSAV